jgi:hypothetical protein
MIALKYRDARGVVNFAHALYFEGCFGMRRIQQRFLHSFFSARVQNHQITKLR